MVASVRQNLNNAGIKVTDLPQADLPLTGAEIFMVIQGGVSKQVSADDVINVGTGVLVYASPAGASNDVVPPGFDESIAFLEVDTNAGNAQWTGLIAGEHNQRVIVTNLGPNQLRLDANNVGSTPANRFRAASNLILLTNMSTEVVYCAEGVNRWLVSP
jgi:hypothetical protein